MTTPHADWPKTLEWVEKQAQESLKARFFTAEIIAKEAQTTLTVLLAAVGGSAAYAAKIFEANGTGPIEIGAMVVCIFLVLLAIILVVTCMMFQSYPAQYQNPENLMLSDYSIDVIREAELKNIGERIKEAAKLNKQKANRLNVIRIFAALSPIIFVLVAAFSPQKSSTVKDKTTLACNVEPAANGSLKLKCELEK